MKHRNSLIRMIGVAVLSLWMSGESGPVFAEESESPKEEVASIEKLSDLSYCESSEKYGLCDLYLPSDSGALRPVVLVVHGGGWVSGDKWTMEKHCRRLAGQGIAAVSMNYRLAPKHKFPCQVDDVRAALAWIHDHADEYRLDIARVGLYGYSAGGHLVSLVGTLADEPWSKVERTTTWAKTDSRWKKQPKVTAVCAGGPPTDFEGLPKDNTALAYFLGGSRAEKPEVYAAASPLGHVSPSDPPFQLIHGDTDLIVPISGSELFRKQLSASGVSVTMTTIPKCGHIFTFINPKLTVAMVDFFTDELRDSAETKVKQP